MEKKKYGLFKIIGIAFLLYVILTWIIPVGSFYGSEFQAGETNPVGLYGIFTSPIYGLAIFIQYLILILCVGGFYGVLNRTGSYQKIINFFEKKDRTKFIVSTIIIFSLITSLLGETMMVFLLLPFFVTVLLKMGYSKITSILAIIGGSFIGTIASISGNFAIYKNYFNLESNLFIVYNVILLAIFVFLLSMFIISKKEKKVKNENIPLYENIRNNKSCVPLIIILSFLLILLFLGLFNWYYAFNIDVFETLYEKLTTIELFGTQIIGKIFGVFSPIGSFSNYDMSAILIIFSIIIGWIYSIKFDDFIDSFKNGVKQIIVPGIYVVFASVIFSLVVTASDGNISLTISNFILGKSNDFNIVTGVLTGTIGSFFYNDYLYLLNGLHDIISLYNTNMLPFILSVFQSMFGIMMFVLPVSMILVGGLKYLDISYKDWIKYIWKFLVQIFIISIIGCIIVSMIV